MHKVGTVLRIPKKCDAIDELLLGKSPREQYGEIVIIHKILEDSDDTSVIVFTNNLGGGCAYLPPYLLEKCEVVGWIFDIIQDALDNNKPS